MLTKNSRWYYAFLALISFVFVLLFSRSTSPLYAYVGYDAAIFKQMGMAILKGKTIYLDYFDNKGCLLYFLHALCLWLGGDFVILVFQAISLTISLILLDKIISLYKEGSSRLFILMIGMVLLLCFYEGGDLTEEWSLPFICYPLYAFLKSYKEDKSLKTKELYYIGLCFGVIAFLRINNAVPFCGFLVCLFIENLLKKQWKLFIINVLAFVAGVLTITVPCFLYFYLKAGSEGVWWMAYCTFLSGFEYLGVNVKVPIIVMVCYYLVVVVFFIIAMMSKNIKKVPMVLGFVMFLLAFGTKCLEHYQIVMIPLYVLCISTFNVTRRWLKYSLIILLFLDLMTMIIRPMGFFVYEVLAGNDKFENVYSDFHDIMIQIPENERDSICNYNTYLLGYGLLYNENKIQCNYVSLSPFSGGMTGLDRYRRLLADDKPLWVMIYHGAYYTDDMHYLQNYYEERFVLHYDTKYLKNLNGFGIETDVYFFRRKD